ncbi:hypothetical protein C8A00DRAFT_32797 [Chaetomidium leptoderma]|uniref:Uncharacterized protein n=1 Tax=Chaetomidium leptoderma TaxID=669021 RepID=A0AAN6ZZB6_9PEZI|nr:hypothetical protein C8A00DRAFT_32797 [Chaetomidium leptoderma]
MPILTSPRPPSASASAVAVASDEEEDTASPWPEIELNYFTSMRAHREEEDRTLEADYRVKGEALEKQLMENYNAQEALVQQLKVLRGEYEKGQANLEGLMGELEGQREVRRVEREREDEERKAWFGRFRRGGLAYRVAEEKKEEEVEEVEDEEWKAESGDPEDVVPADAGKVVNGQEENGEPQHEQPASPENDTSETSETETPVDGHHQQEPQVVEEEMPDADDLTNGHHNGEEHEQPVAALEKSTPDTGTLVNGQEPVADKEVLNTEALVNGQEEPPQAAEEGTQGPAADGQGKAEISSLDQEMRDAVPAEDGNNMDGVEAMEDPELPGDAGLPIADVERNVEAPPPDQQVTIPALPAEHQESGIDNAQQSLLSKGDIPEDSVAADSAPAEEDVEMPDVQALTENETIETLVPEVPVQAIPAAPASPSSSSELSSRHTTPELDTPVSLPRELSPPATPEDTASAIIDVLGESGTLLGRLQSFGTNNYWDDLINTYDVKRPVQIRPGRKFTAEDLDAVPRPKSGDARAFKFLSFFVQAMGELQERPCQDCALNHGLYQGCVAITNDGNFPRCGNCEWSKRRCHAVGQGSQSSSRHSVSAKSPTKSPTKARASRSFTPANNANNASFSQDDEEQVGTTTTKGKCVEGDGNKETSARGAKKGPRKSLPTTRKAPMPSTPSAKPVESEADRLPEINKEVLSLRDNGTTFTDPPLMRGVPLAKITSDDEYWEPDWKSIEEIVEPIRLKHQERYEHLEQTGSTNRDKHLARRDAKRGETILRFLKEGELHPYQLVGKKWINYRITNYDTLFRLAQLLLEELPRMGLDISPSQWLRHRLHEVSLEKGDKFDVASWIGKAYHDRKLEQIREKNGFPRVGRPPAHATKSAGPSSSRKKAPVPRSLKRKDPHDTPESTPSKPQGASPNKETPAAAAAASASASASATGQQKPKKIKIITSRAQSTGEPLTTSTPKPNIILNSPFPPSATVEDDSGTTTAASDGSDGSDGSTGLEYDGYTTSDSISDDKLHEIDWRLHQVKTRTFATNPGVTQYWHWVTEKKDARVIEHQVLESVRPVKWSVFKKPYNFHLKLGDIQEVAFARGNTKVIVTHKRGKDGKDQNARGDVMAQFKRDRTKRRFLTFLRAEKGVKVVEMDKEFMQLKWDNLQPETLPGPDSD